MSIGDKLNDPTFARDLACAELAGLKLAVTLREITAMNPKVAACLQELLEDLLVDAAHYEFADAYPLGVQAIDAMLAENPDQRIAYFKALFSGEQQTVASFRTGEAN